MNRRRSCYRVELCSGLLTLVESLLQLLTILEANAVHHLELPQLLALDTLLLQLLETGEVGFGDIIHREVPDDVHFFLY